jgi:hypothetical protein
VLSVTVAANAGAHDDSTVQSSRVTCSFILIE